eukprot:15476778-Alexandrium_andersonii.AAC.1
MEPVGVLVRAGPADEDCLDGSLGVGQLHPEGDVRREETLVEQAGAHQGVDDALLLPLEARALPGVLDGSPETLADEL